MSRRRSARASPCAAGEVETVAYNRDKGIGVTVYLGQRRGHASTADFSADAVHAAVGKALAIARFTAEDPAAGLADPDRLARAFPDLDLYDPWELAVEEAVALGCEAEAAALAVDRRLTNTEGATVAWNESEFVYANTHGFRGGYRSTRHHIDCSVIGDPGDGGGMQRDYWYTAGRGASDLQPASEVGRIAGERTVRRLGARKLGTVECPVLFEAPGGRRPHRRVRRRGVGRRAVPQVLVPAGFARHSRCSRRTSRSARIRTYRARRGSAPFDNEGVATAPRDVVTDGVVRGYFLGSYSARKLGMVTTGNAGGSHNLVVAHGDDDLAALMRRMGRGLFVTEQLGQGVNPVTGDYSRGAAGFWIEDGAIAYPGRGDHDRRQPQGHLPRHRRDRTRRRSPRIAAHRDPS